MVVVELTYRSLFPAFLFFCGNSYDFLLFSVQGFQYRGVVVAASCFQYRAVMAAARASMGRFGSPFFPDAA